LKNSRRFAAALVLIITGIVCALAGSAGVGNAAPGVTFTFEPLLGTSSINEIQTVSYGKGIGFHLLMQNGTNSAPHSSKIVVTTNNGATYDSSSATFNGVARSCNPTGSNVLECLLPDTLVQGDTFEAFIRFKAPTSTAFTYVSTTATMSVAAQTVGGNKNKGTTLASGTVTTNLTSEVTTDNAYLKKNETASTGVFADLTSSHPQNFSLMTPAGLLNGAFGVAVGIHDRFGDPGCVGGRGSCTTLNIPAAHFFDTLGNPFYNGIAAPYTWSMNALYTGGPPTGVAHVDDNGDVHQLKGCAAIGGHPTPAEPLCVNLPVETFSNPKEAHVTGEGIANGGLGFT
jgi:hypothetical protein